MAASVAIAWLTVDRVGSGLVFKGTGMKSALMAVIVAAGAWAGSASALSLFNAPDGDFTVAFVSASDQAAEPAAGANKPSFQRFEGKQGDETFVVTIDRYPAHVRAPVPSDGIYQRLAWIHAHDPGVELVSDHAAPLSSLPGWEATYRVGGQTEVRRILMFGGSIYQLSVTGSAAPADAAAFFGSFTMTPAGLLRSRTASGPAI